MLELVAIFINLNFVWVWEQLFWKKSKTNAEQKKKKKKKKGKKEKAYLNSISSKSKKIHQLENKVITPRILSQFLELEKKNNNWYFGMI